MTAETEGLEMLPEDGDWD